MKLLAAGNYFQASSVALHDCCLINRSTVTTRSVRGLHCAALSGPSTMSMKCSRTCSIIDLRCNRMLESHNYQDLKGGWHMPVLPVSHTVCCTRGIITFLSNHCPRSRLPLPFPLPLRLLTTPGGPSLSRLVPRPESTPLAASLSLACLSQTLSICPSPPSSSSATSPIRSL